MQYIRRDLYPSTGTTANRFKMSFMFPMSGTVKVILVRFGTGNTYRGLRFHCVVNRTGAPH